MVEYETILRSEFDGETGSFLVQLRTKLHWDKVAFDRLTRAMETCASTQETHAAIPRWIAEGFWYLDTHTQDWISHPSFPRVHGDKYYSSGIARLRDLSYWLFVGERPVYVHGA